MNPAEAENQVRAVYTEVESLDLTRDCIARTTCCHFLLTGKTPMLTPGEALVAARGVRASGRRFLPTSTDPGAGRCPLLGSDSRCTIYQHRPFGCRTHFCAEAGGAYPRKAVQHLIQKLETIADAIAPRSDPRPLPAAVADALIAADGKSRCKNGAAGKRNEKRGRRR